MPCCRRTCCSHISSFHYSRVSTLWFAFLAIPHVSEKHSKRALSPSLPGLRSRAFEIMPSINMHGVIFCTSMCRRWAQQSRFPLLLDYPQHSNHNRNPSLPQVNAVLIWRVVLVVPFFPPDWRCVFWYCGGSRVALVIFKIPQVAKVEAQKVMSAFRTYRPDSIPTFVVPQSREDTIIQSAECAGHSKKAWKI